MSATQFGYVVAAAVGVAACYYWPKVYAAVKAKFVKTVDEVKAKV